MRYSQTFCPPIIFLSIILDRRKAGNISPVDNHPSGELSPGEQYFIPAMEADALFSWLIITSKIPISIRRKLLRMQFHAVLSTRKGIR